MSTLLSKDLLWILLVGGGYSSFDIDLSNICMDERNKGVLDAITGACFCPGATMALVASSSSSSSPMGIVLLDQCYAQLKGSLVAVSNNNSRNIAAPSLSARDIAKTCALLRRIAINGAGAVEDHTRNNNGRSGDGATGGTSCTLHNASSDTTQALKVLESRLQSFAETRRRQAAQLMAERAILTSTLASPDDLYAVVTLASAEAPQRLQVVLGASCKWTVDALVRHAARQQNIEPEVRAEALIWAWHSGWVEGRPCGVSAAMPIPLLAAIAALVYRRGFATPSSREGVVCERGLEMCVHVVQALLVTASVNGQASYDESFRLDCHEVLGHAMARVLYSCDLASKAWANMIDISIAGYLSRAPQALPALSLADASCHLSKVLQRCPSVTPLLAFITAGDVGNADLSQALVVNVLEVCPHPKMVFSGAVVVSILRLAFMSGANSTLDALHQLRPYLLDHSEVFLSLLLAAIKAAVASSSPSVQANSSSYATVNGALNAAFHYLSTLRSRASPNGLALPLVQMSCSSFDPCPSEPWTIETLASSYNGPFVAGQLVLLGLASRDVGEQLCAWLVEQLYKAHPSCAVGVLLVATAIHRNESRPSMAAAAREVTPLCVTLTAMVKEMRQRGWKAVRVADILHRLVGDLEVRQFPGAAGAEDMDEMVCLGGVKSVLLGEDGEGGTHEATATGAELVQRVVRSVFVRDTGGRQGALCVATAKAAGKLAASLWLRGGASDVDALDALVSTCLQTEVLSELLAFHRDEEDYDTAMHISLHAPVEAVFLLHEVPIPLSHIGRSAVRLELILAPPDADRGNSGSGLLLVNLPARTIAAVHFISGLFLSDMFDGGRHYSSSRVLTDDMERVLQIHAQVLVPQLLATMHVHHLINMFKSYTTSASPQHNSNANQSPIPSPASASYCAACITLARHLSLSDRVSYVGTLLANPSTIELLMAVALGLGYSDAARDVLVKEMLVLCEDVSPNPAARNSRGESGSCLEGIVALPLWAVLSILRVFHGIPTALASRVDNVLQVDPETINQLHGASRRWDLGVPCARLSTEANVCAKEWPFDTLISSEYEMVCVTSRVCCSVETLTIEIKAVRHVSNVTNSVGADDSNSRTVFDTILGIGTTMPAVACSSLDELRRTGGIVVLPSFQSLWNILINGLEKLPCAHGRVDVTQLAALLFQLLKYFYPVVSDVVGDDWMLYSLCSLRAFGGGEVQSLLLLDVLDALLSQCACDGTLGDLRCAILRTVMHGNPSQMSDAMTSPSFSSPLSCQITHDPVTVIAELSSHFVTANAAFDYTGDGMTFLSTLAKAVTASMSSRSDGNALRDGLSRDDAVKIVSCCASALNIMCSGADQCDSGSDTKQLVRTIVSGVVNRKHSRAVAVEMGSQKSLHRWKESTLHKILSALRAIVDRAGPADPVQSTSLILQNTLRVEFGTPSPPSWLRARPWVSKLHEQSTPRSPRHAKTSTLQSDPTPITPSKRRMVYEFPREDERRSMRPSATARTSAVETTRATALVRPVPRKLASGVSSRDSTPFEVSTQSPVLDAAEDDWGDDGEVPWEECTGERAVRVIETKRKLVSLEEVVEEVDGRSVPGFAGVSVEVHGADLVKEVDKWKDTAAIATKFAVSF